MTATAIAYTYDADMHCPTCAIARFGQEPAHKCAVCGEREASGPWHEQHAFGPLADHDYEQTYHDWPRDDATDTEGNPVGAVFQWDDWCSECGQDGSTGEHSESCGTCQALIASHGCRDCGTDHSPNVNCHECGEEYPGALTWPDGSPIRCDDKAGHPGSHGHSFAARYWPRSKATA